MFCKNVIETPKSLLLLRLLVLLFVRYLPHPHVPIPDGLRVLEAIAGRFLMLGFLTVYRHRFQRPGLTQ